VATAGSIEVNDGDITIDPTSSGSGSRQALIAAGDGQTLIAHYTVPAGMTGYFVGGQVSIASKSGSSGIKEARIRLYKKNSGGAWRLQAEYGGRSDGTAISPDINFTVPLSFPAQTEIKWTVNSENNNTSVYVQYNLILIDD